MSTRATVCIPGARMLGLDCDEIEVDRSMGPLAKAIRALGLHVWSAWDHDPRHVTIAFPTFEHAMRWLEVVAQLVGPFEAYDLNQNDWTIEATPYVDSEGLVRKPNALVRVRFPRRLVAKATWLTRYQVEDRAHHGATSPEGETSPRASRKARPTKARKNDAQAHGLPNVEAAPSGPVADHEPASNGHDDGQRTNRANVSSWDTHASNGGATASKRQAPEPTSRAAGRDASREPSTSTRSASAKSAEDCSSSAAPANPRRKRDRVLRRNARKGGSAPSEGSR